MAGKAEGPRARKSEKTKQAKKKISKGGGLAGKAATLRAVALAFPETREDFPWGHSAFKVGSKAFVFMSLEEGRLSFSMKLPQSADFALMQPWAQPTGYGLGKSGWVSAVFEKPREVPVELLRQWFEESYLAIAPRKIAARLRR